MAPHPRAGARGGPGGPRRRGASSISIVVILLAVALFSALVFAYWGHFRCYDTVGSLSAKSQSLTADLKKATDQNTQLQGEVKSLKEQLAKAGINAVPPPPPTPTARPTKPPRITVVPDRPTAAPPNPGRVRLGGDRRGEVQAVVESNGLGSTSFDTRHVAVIVFCYNRPDYLRRTLEHLFTLHPGGDKFPVFASQDGSNAPVREVLRSFQDKVTRFEHPRIPKPPYVALADHYKWALTKLFNEIDHLTHVIILEDDMEIAPDFFEYFTATGPLLERDPTLWCISSWNDNGQGKFVSSPEALYRSDFFPGLGWMMTKTLYRELEPGWAPTGYWDDWMRLPKVRKDRVCIHPELCRTYNFGEKGGSSGNQFGNHLKMIKRIDKKVNWAGQDLSYLLKNNYDQLLKRELSSARQVGAVNELKQGDVDVKLSYRSYPHFRALANQIGIMSDEKQMIPRTAYLGVVQYRINGGEKRAFLVPDDINNKLR